MTMSPNIQSSTVIIDEYIKHGWSLVPVPPGTKKPCNKGWNLKSNSLSSQNELPQGYGVGLAHAYSGTMALDIDEWSIAERLLSKAGINLHSLYSATDAVIINSGKAGHGKLLYAMPFGIALTSKKILENNITIYELRCATSGGLTVQDILPPSIHPDTQKPYCWAGQGNWKQLPLIPQKLLDLWTELLDKDKQCSISVDGSLDVSWDEIRQALEVIPADCSREQWISIGMALHWGGTQTNQLEQALCLWNDWSATAQTKYQGEKEILSQWSSFRSDKNTSVRLGTLFHIAKENGWARKTIDVSELFKKTTAEIKNPAELIDNLRIKPPEMDLSFWPDILRQRAIEIGDSVGCDPLVPLFSGLAAVCGVVDARIRLELMPGFQVPPILWLMTLGNPADKKSPGSKPMLSPLKGIELDDRPRYAKELLDWEGKEAAYSSAKKSFLEWSSSSDGLLGNDQAPYVPELPPQPVPLKITVSDITSQKLVRQAASRPRGLLCYLDEMNSWVRKITDKSSGEDRSAWVSSYESQPYEMDRVGAGSIHCDNFAVSFYGNIQPKVLKYHLGLLSMDGLIQRFIPAILQGKKTRLGNPVPEYMTSADSWENLLRLVFALPVQTYYLSREAFEIFREYQKWYEDAKQDERTMDSNSEYMEAFGKLEGLTGRLILLFHIIESPFSVTVQPDIVRRVISIVRGYVIPAYRYTFSGMSCSSTSDYEKLIIDHVVQNSSEVLTCNLTSLKHSGRRWFENEPDWQRERIIMDTMYMLEQAGWVLKIEDEPHKKHVVWAINPNIPTMFKDYREAIIKAKQRHVDYSYRFAYEQGNERKFVKGYDPSTMDE